MTIREACKNSDLDLVARLQLLEIVEMRSVKWKPNDDVSNYYKHKLHQIEVYSNYASCFIDNGDLKKTKKPAKTSCYITFQQDNAQEAIFQFKDTIKHEICYISLLNILYECNIELLFHLLSLISIDASHITFISNS